MVAIACLLTGVACTSTHGGCPKAEPVPPVRSGFLGYADNVDCFSMQYPSDWIKQPHANGTIVTFSAPAGKAGTFRSSMNLTSESLPQNSTLASYTAAARNQITSTLPNVKFLESKPTELAGSPAYEFTYTAASGGLTLQLRMLTTVVNGRAYVLTYSASQKNFDSAAAQAGQMIDSFRLTT